MTRITDVRGDQPESAGWLFKSPFVGGGVYCAGPTTGRTACIKQSLLMFDNSILNKV